MELTRIALEGLRQAEDKLERVAKRTASQNPGDRVELSQNAVELLEAKNHYLASLKLIKAAEETEKHILDILG
ncbi:MAG: hypothetical protein FJW20_25645 [Acidimicrobiia bacterium]|nr:hypothetical protein [Acidimicrobiia bacterium]